jgi:hypothetical protein
MYIICQLLQVLLFFLQRHATCKGCQQAHVLLQGMTLRIVLQEAPVHGLNLRSSIHK